MGVRRIREFNMVLLGKWCWRLLAEKDSLWFMVLVERYMVDGGMVRDGVRVVSAWWKPLQAMRHKDGLEVRMWFDNNLIGVMAFLRAFGLMGG